MSFPQATLTQRHLMENNQLHFQNPSFPFHRSPHFSYWRASFCKRKLYK
ncbi:hypothetical protein NC651_012602 [Populus alba x Populus x berolinensis]|nr:hypothetical protein NC651_012602 [Populus alba x Populus x berolinensis]